ncbi:MAG: hypothetical protein F4X58_04425 [Chloroflexi bacterium]|nr:hypothetical protein [Chloroflexota bacterium]MYC01147.1 hypothetical protein [Chloroflexota bacterium]
MSNSIRRVWLITLVLGLFAAAALAGCSGDEPPAQPVTPAAQTSMEEDQAETSASQAEQRGGATATGTDMQTESIEGDGRPAAAEGASEPSAGGAAETAAPDPPEQSALTLDSATTWRDVYETLTAAEQGCVTERLGDETESVLARAVLDDGPAETWHVELFTCFTAETGRELLLRTALAGMAEEGLELGEEATDCLREVVAGVDPPAVIAAAQVDGPEVNEFLGEVWRCLPELMIDSIAGELGLDVEAVSEPELDCLRTWARGLDAVALLEAMQAGDEPTLVELSFGVFRCSPALLLSGFGEIGADIDGEAEACLRQLIEESEASDLLDEGSPEYERFYTELLVCLPVLSQVTGATSAASAGGDAPDDPDDHADSLDGATVITVGVEASGELGSDYDSDYFVFEAEQGVLFEIVVGLATLSDSVLTLYDGEWRQLAASDDHADSLASRLYWVAEYSGDHYIEVWGYGLGSYTLLVEPR